MKKQAIHLQAKRFVLGSFQGLYRSLFRGRGLDYDEIRKYVPGDDPKAFVWAKLAQLGEPYVKTFLEERDLSVLVAIDTSSSFFWPRKEKSSLALEAAALLTFSAAVSRDRIGLALFSDKLEKFVLPRRGLAHAGRIIQELTNITPSSTKTSFVKSLQDLQATRGPKRAVIFLISDFISDEENWFLSLKTLASHNDLIALRVLDEWDINPPSLGWVMAQDPEEKTAHLTFCDGAFAKELREAVLEKKQAFDQFAKLSSISVVDLVEGKEVDRTLISFFETRKKILKR